MGQYWKPVNIDKREFIHPHRLGEGLKLWEIVANTTTVRALAVLLAAMPQRRGGGDIAEGEIVGRWAGDRVALVGDYAERGDIPSSPIPAPLLYALTCGDDIDREKLARDFPGQDLAPFEDVSGDVLAYLKSNELE